MCGLIEIAGKIWDLIADPVIQLVRRHVCYVIRYKKNLKDLEVEQKDLETQMGKIERNVDEVKTKGEIVEDDIVEWVQLADKMKHENEEFMDAKAGNENTRCLRCTCPNLISRYRMSKQAEQRIGEIKGHTEKGKSFRTFGHPAPFPQEIQYKLSRDFVNFESRTPLLKKIKEAIAAPAVKMVGVYGTGGVGKTTTVEVVGKQLKAERLFDDVVIAVVSQNANTEKIQVQIADCLDLKLQKTTEEGRAGELLNRLCNGKKNLVILDDLWEELNLMEIGIPTDCKVILTTRNRDVLSKMEVDRDFPVQLLSQEEAWALFKRKAGDAVDTHELHSIAERVCAECGGLPVAIAAVGAALKGKKKNIWADALDQLENSSLHKIEGIDPKLFVSLKLSCDALGKEAKSCFLLCCLYAEDAEILIDDLLHHCVARRLLDPNKNTMEKARGRVLTLVDTLKTCSLLLDGRSEYFVKMHDVIRDVGISIAKTEEGYMFKHDVTEWPDQSTYEHLSAMSLEVKNVSGVPTVLVCRKLHTFMLESSDRSFEFPDSFFSEVKELAILVLKNVSMQSIPSSLKNLLSLRMLRLDCELKDVNILCSLKDNLEVLRIRWTVWEALPLVLGELTRLQVLDLTGCYIGLLPSGVLSKLTRLEELYLPDSNSNLWAEEHWENIDTGDKVTEVSRAKATELLSLTKLSTLHVSIPFVTQVQNLRLDSLTRYQISVGGHFYAYHDRIWEKMLILKHVTIQDEANNLLQMCQYLFLEYVKGLKNVFDVGGVEFVELRSLRMEYCNDVDYLHPQGLHQTNSFSNLTVLNVRNCSFNYLFSLSCAKKLTQLEELEIVLCENLKEIIRTEGENDGQESEDDVVHFTQLKRMRLYGLSNLVSFYSEREETTESEGISCSPEQFLFNENVTFPALEELSLTHVPNIENVKRRLREGEVRFPTIQRLIINFDLWYEDGEANMQLFSQQNLEGEGSSSGQN